MAGSSLAVSGVIIQRVLNNPLAAPNMIGFYDCFQTQVLQQSAVLVRNIGTSQF